MFGFGSGLFCGFGVNLDSELLQYYNLTVLTQVETFTLFLLAFAALLASHAHPHSRPSTQSDSSITSNPIWANGTNLTNSQSTDHAHSAMITD